MDLKRLGIPTEVYCEENAVLNHAEDLAKLGKKALIVTGEYSAKACGVYKDLVQALESVGVDHCLFSNVEPNPCVHTVMNAREFAYAQEADFVIGAGGGSPMDASKAIALMAAHIDRKEDHLYTPGADSSALPVVCVPTTCGTGSEVTGVSVLTNEELQTKKSISHKIWPVLSLVDGKYLMHANRGTISSTGFDALSHMLESWLNTSATPASREAAEEGIRLWKDNFPVLRGDEELGVKEAADLMRAAVYGGAAISMAGTSLPHALSYALTYHRRTPHGKAVCFFMAGYLKAADPADAAHLLELAGFEDADAFHKAYTEICGPLHIEKEDLTALVEKAVKDLAADSARCAKAPFPVDEEVLRKIAFYGLTES